jgi:hypothetical protein
MADIAFSKGMSPGPAEFAGFFRFGAFFPDSNIRRASASA